MLDNSFGHVTFLTSNDHQMLNLRTFSLVRKICLTDSDESFGVKINFPAFPISVLIRYEKVGGESGTILPIQRPFRQLHDFLAHSTTTILSYPRQSASSTPLGSTGATTSCHSSSSFAQPELKLVLIPSPRCPRANPICGHPLSFVTRKQGVGGRE